LKKGSPKRKDLIAAAAAGGHKWALAKHLPPLLALYKERGWPITAISEKIYSSAICGGCAKYLAKHFPEMMTKATDSLAKTTLLRLARGNHMGRLANYLDQRYPAGAPFELLLEALAAAAEGIEMSVFRYLLYTIPFEQPVGHDGTICATFTRIRPWNVPFKRLFLDRLKETGRIETTFSPELLSLLWFEPGERPLLREYGVAI
jgi:hypothetical protein